MSKNLHTPPVRTRVPLAAWTVAAIVTLVSLMSSLLHGTQAGSHFMPSAERSLVPKAVQHQAKV
jgi:hypothetical protein